MRLGQQYGNLLKFTETQKEMVAATNSLFEARLSVLTAAGGTISGSVEKAFGDYNEYVKQINQANDLIDTQISLMEQASSTYQKIPGSAQDVAAAMEKINSAIKSGNLDDMEKTIAEVAHIAGGIEASEARVKSLKAEQVRNGMSILENAKRLSTIYRENQRMQEVEVSQMEANISLADNLAMGVAASAQMRMAEVRAISDVINSKRAEQLVIEKLIAGAQQRQVDASNALSSAENAKDEKAQLKAQRELNQAKADEYQQTLRYKEINVENTRLVQKQAELTRVLRDGWINAINAMNNGVGMFTKIKIDRETRLGTLMSRAPKPVVGIGTGFAGPGRRESVAYSPLGPGILTNPDRAGGAFGAGSHEWAKAIDKRTPLGMMGGGGGGMIDPDEAASGVSLWQELIGKNISTATAGAAAAPFGTAGLLGEIDKIADKVTSNVQTIKTEAPLPVNIVGSTLIPVDMQGAIGRNKGGIIPGGGLNVDSVPMVGTPGEGVLTREAMKVIGKDALDALNSGKITDMDQFLSAQRDTKKQEYEEARQFFSSYDTSNIDKTNLGDQLRGTRQEMDRINNRLHGSLDVEERMRLSSGLKKDSPEWDAIMMKGEIPLLERSHLQDQLKDMNVQYNATLAAIAQRKFELRDRIENAGSIGAALEFTRSLSPDDLELIQPEQPKKKEIAKPRTNKVTAPQPSITVSVPVENVTEVPEDIRSWQKSERDSLQKASNSKFRKELAPVWEKLRQGGPDRMETSQKVNDMQKSFEEQRKKIEGSKTYEEFLDIANLLGVSPPHQPPEVAQMSVRPASPVTPGLNKDRTIEDFAKSHPELLSQATIEASSKLDNDIAGYNAKEEMLIQQLRHSANKDQIRQVAAQRIANRDQLRTAQSERMSIDSGVMTPTISYVLANLKRQSEQEASQLQAKEAASKQAVKGPSVTAPIIGKAPDVGERWWDNPDKRTADGAPLAVSQPPTRETAPNLFASLDAATVIPPEYPGAPFEAEFNVPLRNIMQINDSGARRNEELKKFIEKCRIDLSDIAQNGLPLTEAKIVSLQDKLDKAKGIKEGKPEEMFLPLDQTGAIAADLEEAKKYKIDSEMSKTLISRQVDFAEKAYMPLVDKYVGVQEKIRLQDEQKDYQQRNSGRLPNQPPEIMSKWIVNLDNLLKQTPASSTESGSGKIQFNDKYDRMAQRFTNSSTVSSADELKIRASQLNILQNLLPKDDEGLRAAYYAQQIEDISDEALPRNKSDEQRSSFYQTIKDKALSIKNLVRGGNYKTYQGQARPIVDEINQMSVQENQGYDEIKSKFDSLYSNIILSPDVDFGRYKLPQLARGGLVPQSTGGQPVVVGEGQFPEIVSPIPTLEKVVNESLQHAISDERQKAIAAAQSSISPIMNNIDRSVGRATGEDDYSGSVGGETTNVQITLSETQMSQVKDALVREMENAFRGVSTAAMARVMDDLNNGV
jgi:hypothetical protein